MRRFEKLVICVFVISALLFGGSRVYKRVLVDSTPPVISFDTDTLTVSVSDPREKLLEGAHASDNRDGDLSGEIQIKSVSSLVGDNKAKVYYIVFDSSDNYSVASRYVCYSDYSAPRFALSAPLVYAPGSMVTLLDRLTATDVIDGDISGDIRVTARSVAINYEGSYEVTVQVTNSLGDTSVLTLTVDIDSATAEKQRIYLKEYIVYIEQGAQFNAEDYILRISGSASAKATYSHNVDTTKAGTYEVVYTCTDTDGVSSVRLTVVVI